MKTLFSYNMFLLFLGGIFSLVFTVIIIIAKQNYKRVLERERLKALWQHHPEAVGELEAKLNDSFEFRRFDFFELLTIWSLQPLFIICIVNLISETGTVEVVITFGLVIFIFAHEFWAAAQYSRNRWYQLSILTLWILVYFIYSYRDNTIHQQNKYLKERIEVNAGQDKKFISTFPLLAFSYPKNISLPKSNIIQT